MQSINDTGVRGYLKWLKADQPNIYKVAAPMIAQRIPEAFSDHEQSKAQGALMGLADDGLDLTSFTPDLSIVGTDAATAPSDLSIDVSDAANTGAASSSVASGIQNIVSSISNLFMTKAQANVYSQIGNAQATRIAAGLPPAQISSNSLGIPTLGPLGTTATAGGGLLLVAAIIGGAILLSGRKKG